MIERIRKFISANLFLLAIIAVSSFFRLYNLGPSLMFQGDQGRDAMLAANVFKNGDLLFIGPVTSLGNMYLGPLYYYFMVPFLMLTYPSPIGPAIGVALLGILTSALIYTLGSKLTNKTAAAFAAFLYTFSATAVLYNRFSWNPNPAPLFGLLLVYYSWRAFKKPMLWWVVGLLVAIIIQLHYLTLLAVGAAGLCWLYHLFTQFRSKTFSRDFLVGTVSAVAIFLISLTPLLLFDFKHGWLNAKAFSGLLSGGTFAAQQQTSPAAKVWSYIKETDGRSQHIFAEHAIGKWRSFNRFVVLIVLVSTYFSLKKQPKSNYPSGIAVLSVFAAVGVIGTSLYQHTVFDHYISYLFPIAFLLHGLWMAQLYKSTVGKIALVVICGLFILVNIPKMPLKTTGWTIDDIAKTSQSIADKVAVGEKYNIVLISESKDIDGQNYRYYLSTNQGKEPVLPEHRGDVQTLFIIDEIKDSPEVTQLPIYEIVTFPNKNPSEVYQIPNGPEITILRR